MSNYTSLIIGNMISKISLTPSKKQLDELYKKSMEAQQQSVEYKDHLSPKNLISKNPNCKDSGFSTTIFSKESLAFSKQGDFMIFLDQNPPITGLSMGPNCVPVVPKSINIFDTNEKTTFENLDTFMKWRRENKKNIIRAYIHSMEQFIQNPEKRSILEKSLSSRGQSDLEATIEDYSVIASFFRSILSTNDIKRFRIKSFCQSWIKKGIVGEPCFSVPSPHFQTFVYIDTNDLPSPIVDSYNSLIRILSHDMTTKIVNGRLEYEKSFVDLDNLYSHMGEKNMFFINSAPSFDTLPLIIEARESSKGAFFVVISASLEQYMDSITCETVNISSLPSNFRAPIAPGAKINGIECTAQNYSQIQNDISSSLVDIFSWCFRKNVNVFFAAIKRGELRPLYVQTTGNNAKVNFDRDLTNEVLDKLVIPSLSRYMGHDEQSFNAVELALEKHSKYNASFLSDIICVAVASEFLSDEKLWDSYTLVDMPKVKNSANVENYFYAKFIKGNGLFKSLNFDGACRAGEAIRKAINFDLKPWKTCYIMHDAFLNDIDDQGANDLARSLTAEKGFFLFKNYD